jgi:hypothetical protein
MKNKMTKKFNLDMAPDDWEMFDKEDGRLYATVIILGTYHHLEAIPVKATEDAKDEGVTDTAVALMDDLHVAFGGDGPFDTTEINGKQYAIFMSPFCD